MALKGGIRYVLALLVAGIFAVYSGVAEFGFVNFDDDRYVTQNTLVSRGLSWEGVVWAFRTYDYFYWQPLTWLSHMWDVSLFGMNAGAHHIVNVSIHALNCFLLFLGLYKLTGARAESVIAAALWALHPLRVESVAWIAERKDMLAGLFWLLTLLAWTAYVEKPGRRPYAVVVLTVGAGLMSKPSVVTLPLVLLVVDWWPLNRKNSWKQRILEKAPLIALAAAVAVATYAGQQAFGAVKGAQDIPPGIRIANVPLAYVDSLFAIFWPQSLAVLYPYRTSVAWHQVIPPVLMLAAITLGAISQRRSRPYLLAGWLWFLVTLAPNAGWIQAGAQSHADRFTYLPSIGITVAVVWAIAGIARSRGVEKSAAWAGAVAAVLLAVAAAKQVEYWRGSVELFTRAVEVTEDNPTARHNLALALAAKGDYGKAIPHYREALRLQRNMYQGHYNLGSALFAEGKLEDAMASFAEAARLKPDYAEAHYALALSALNAGKGTEAFNHFEDALRIGLPAPYAAVAHNSAGVLLAQQGRFAEAESRFRRATELDPALESARRNLSLALASRNASGQ